MTGKQCSAGILLHRAGKAGREVLLVHPGGPFWARKDLGAWSIPKGELDDGEDPRACALREFAEETGTHLPAGALAELGSVKLKSGKLVLALAAEGDLDPATLVSNTFELEWPPRPGWDSNPLDPVAVSGIWLRGVLSCAQFPTGVRRLLPGLLPRADAASTTLRSPGFGQ